MPEHPLFANTPELLDKAVRISTFLDGFVFQSAGHGPTRKISATWLPFLSARRSGERAGGPCSYATTLARGDQIGQAVFPSVAIPPCADFCLKLAPVSSDK